MVDEDSGTDQSIDETREWIMQKRMLRLLWDAVRPNRLDTGMLCSTAATAVHAQSSSRSLCPAPQSSTVRGRDKVIAQLT